MTDKYDTFHALQKQWDYHAVTVSVMANTHVIIDTYLINNNIIYAHKMEVNHRVPLKYILDNIKHVWYNQGVSRYDLDNIIPQIEKELKTYANISTD